MRQLALRLAALVAVVVIPTVAAGCGSGNKRPTIRQGLFVTESTTSVRVCDDTPGRMAVRVVEERRVDEGMTRRVLARTIESPAPDRSCRAYNLGDPHPASWVFGSFTYTFRVRDREGLWSQPVRFSFARGGE